MTSTRKTFLDVASVAGQLLDTPEVAASWNQPSALPQMSVRGLAGHLAGQVFFIPTVLTEPVPSEPSISLDEYYARVSWIGSDLDTPFNQAIRSGGEAEAADGPAHLAARVCSAVEELRRTLLTAPDKPVRRPTWGEWSITLDDFIVSRILELIVHTDDLAYSVGVPTPDLPLDAVETVVDRLSRIAIRRHGPINVLRALSRSERAPASISAL